jgi:hypothetical protein
MTTVPARHLMERASGGLPVPRLAKAGAVVVVVGVLFDLVEHTLGVHVDDMVIAGFSPGEHAAHAVVLVGMVLVLAGVVVDGTTRSRQFRQQRSTRDAVR